MTVKIVDPSVIVLDGACPIGDAEALLRALLETPGARVDWTGCDSAHTAVVQLLMTPGLTVVGPPRGEFLHQIVAGALHRYGVSTAPARKT